MKSKDQAISGFGIFCVIVVVFQGCASFTPGSLRGLDPSIDQAIIVHPVKKNSHQALLSAWQRQGIKWHRYYFISAVIGKNGMADTGLKKEGDGKTPSGNYPLGPAFGYAASARTGMEWRQTGDLDFWVDDPRSLQYNQWVKGKPQARSFEHLKRPDDLYQYAIVIRYNMPGYKSDGSPQKDGHPVIPGAGSAIFMHVWRKYDSPTAGCVAINQRYMRKILRWLNQQYQPVIILE